MTDLDLSTAVFGQTGPGSGTYWGKYESGAIVKDTGYPDFWFPGVTWDRTKKITVTITFDPSNPADLGFRRAWLQTLADADPLTNYDSNTYDFGSLYNNSGGTLVGDVLTIVILPNRWISQGVDPDQNTPYFETDDRGAVVAISYVEETFVSPPPPSGDGSVAGSQWSNARTLTAGNSNVFDVADIYESDTFFRPNNRVYFTFTVAQLTRVAIDTWQSTVLDYNEADSYIDLYLCDTTDNDEAHATLITSSDDTTDGHEGLLSQILRDLPTGTYMLRVGTYADDDVDWFFNYRVNAAFTPLHEETTGWLTTLQDRTDNQLVVGTTEALNDENAWPEWAADPGGWYSDAALGPVRPPGRDSDYFIQRAPGGAHLLAGADACAWAHAINGDRSVGSVFWNGSTTDPDDRSAGFCKPLGEGAISEAGSSYFYEIGYQAPAFGAEAKIEAVVTSPAWAPAFRYVRDNLAERGALPLTLLDPTADGAPEDATLEWETAGPAELVSVEITGDVGGASVTTENSVTIFINESGVAPTYIGSDAFSTWLHGVLGSADLSFAYQDGVDWHTIPGYDDWSDVADDGPDMVITGAHTDALSTSLPAAWDTTNTAADQTLAQSNGGRIGFRFTLRSPRYRWTWVSDDPPPPVVVVTETAMVRQYPGGGLDSAPRLHPTPKTQRLVGGWR